MSLGEGDWGRLYARVEALAAEAYPLVDAMPLGGHETLKIEILPGRKFTIGFHWKLPPPKNQGNC